MSKPAATLLAGALSLFPVGQALAARPMGEVAQVQPQRPAPVDAIVSIRTFQGKSTGEPLQPLADSMGVIVEAEGFILTSYTGLLNPLSDLLADTVFVKLKGEERRWRQADIVSIEPTLNFAILRIEASKPLPAVGFVPADELHTGRALLSASQRSANRFQRGEISHMNTMECYQDSMTATMLKADFDAPSPALGNPIFSGDGRLVALETGYLAPETSETDPSSQAPGHYVLPAFLAFNIYHAVKFKKSFKSPWTGFSVSALNSFQQKQLPVERYLTGVAIDRVWANSPASALGIQPGDLLLRFHHYPIATVADFQKWLYQYGVGAEVKLHLLRDRQLIILPYKIEERPTWAIPK
ncbi:S1C family serine protease [Spongiibacter taiwanensis]|uniref:S1C family serine protease n=1 Tax=Spongiibacter taiwanensis TaxID=1748242 RepID=UPI0020359A54|nr:S1C family serine protease [Spongiibacter taiwanensis]USA42323.1 S1C family serine protease [Spongiibacter taiwanensis]